MVPVLVMVGLAVVGRGDAGGGAVVMPEPLERPEHQVAVRVVAEGQPPQPTPTAKPTPTPTPTPAPLPRSGQLTRGEFDRALAEAGVPRGRWAEVRSVAWCESRWYVDARNPRNRYVYGLLQIDWYPRHAHDRTWAPYAIETGHIAPHQYDSWNDPVVHLRVMRAVWHHDESRGLWRWSQWECQP